MARRMPAEWEPQSAVQFTFPHPDSDWGPTYDEVVPCFVEIIRTAARFQPVLIVCHDAVEVRALFPSALLPRIHLIELASNDTWARDHGGLVVFEDDEPLLLDFMFNGWGLKFPADRDNLLTSQLYERSTFRVKALHRPGLVLEGGSMDFDGAGQALTTARCLLSPNRNPHLDRAAIDRKLRRLFGLDRLFWLEHGFLEGDDTDAHIDTLARFCTPETIAYVRAEDTRDPQVGELRAMEDELRSLRRPDGRPYELLPLPLPGAVYGAAGQRLPATYANFLILNGAVLVPTYGRREDAEALRRLGPVFPDREVIGLPCRPLLAQHGSLHCISMQYPAGVVDWSSQTQHP